MLDAPCGAGRASVHLAKAGCVVTGIDLCSSFIKRAQGRFRKERLPGRFFVLDLREMPFLGEFNAAFNWHGSFGYFTDQENLATLKLYAQALRLGGRFLVDQMNREWLLRHFHERLGDDSITTVNQWHRRTERVNAIWIKKGSRKRNRLSFRMYTPRDSSGTCLNWQALMLKQPTGIGMVKGTRDRASDS